MAEYQNPQQEPGSEKRLLLVFAATFLLIVLAQPLMKKYGLLPTPPEPTSQTAPKTAGSGAGSSSGASLSGTSSSVSSSGTSSPGTSGAAANSVAAAVAKQANSETETVIENDLYRITFTNRGAQVKSWILKKFDNDAQSGPLDLVNPTTAPMYGYPLSLWTYDEGLRERLKAGLYVVGSAPETGINEVRGTTAVVTPSNVELAAQTLKTPASVSFEFSDVDVAVHKTFHFDNSYVVKVETSVSYKGAQVAALPAWPGGFGDQTTAVGYAAGQIVYHSDASTDRTALVFPNYVLRLAIKNVSGDKTYTGPLEWAGPTDQYFTATFMPDDPESAAMVTLRNSLEVLRDPKKDSKEITKVDVLGAAVGNLHGATVERLYAGPKELAVLEATAVPTIKNDRPDLHGLVDFGWWGIIARPLFLWLRWTYFHVVPNWGWAIVLQTLIISLALMPLRITQMKSMLKMQRVAPQIKSIQDKYKKYSMRDPRKAGMNEEVAALYKKEGVNPAGGCLPMLIQFPFLIAYYRMLGTALDLRHAHWLWIHDLSAAEPFPYVLPILMVISMFAMQQITPQPAGMDPAQQKMMKWMMPLMMGFFFFNFASGLSLYYAESNLIQMAQQAVMNKTKLGQEMREMIEKRARKKDK